MTRQAALPAVVLDTDIGSDIDDAMALLLCLRLLGSCWYWRA